MDEQERLKDVERILMERMVGFDEDEEKAWAKLLRTLARRRRLRGRPKTWATSVYYTYCRMTFGEDISRKSVEKLFDMLHGTFIRKYTEIRKLLNLDYFDKRFTPDRMGNESDAKNILDIQQ